MYGQYRNDVWVDYAGNIKAIDAASAVFLTSFLQYLSSGTEYVSALEIIDLQKYKVVKQKLKVRAALRERIRIPFIFVVGKN